MKFYKVKSEFNNCKADKHYNIFIGNELLTDEEMKKSACKIYQ